MLKFVEIVFYTMNQNICVLTICIDFLVFKNIEIALYCIVP